METNYTLYQNNGKFIPVSESTIPARQQMPGESYVPKPQKTYGKIRYSTAVKRSVESGSSGLNLNFEQEGYKDKASALEAIADVWGKNVTFNEVNLTENLGIVYDKGDPVASMQHLSDPIGNTVGQPIINIMPGGKFDSKDPAMVKADIIDKFEKNQLTGSTYYRETTEQDITAHELLEDVSDIKTLFQMAENGKLPSDIDINALSDISGQTIADVLQTRDKNRIQPFPDAIEIDLAAANFDILARNAITGGLPVRFDKFDLADPTSGQTLGHFAAFHGNLPIDFLQWDLPDHQGQTIKDAALAGGFYDFIPGQGMIRTDKEKDGNQENQDQSPFKRILSTFAKAVQAKGKNGQGLGSILNAENAAPGIGGLGQIAGKGIGQAKGKAPQGRGQGAGR